MQVPSLGGKGPLEEGMATHSSILAWRIPWTEEPGGLSSIGSQRVRHDWSDVAHRRAGFKGIHNVSGSDLPISWCFHLIYKGHFFHFSGWNVSSNHDSRDVLCFGVQCSIKEIRKKCLIVLFFYILYILNFFLSCFIVRKKFYSL